MISLIINNKIGCEDGFFENEIRWLTLAFFKNEKIEKDAPKWDYKLKVELGPGSVDATIMDKNYHMSYDTSYWDPKDEKNAKDIMKRMLYDLYSAFTGKTLPWGTLTGIRPAKRIAAFIEQGMSHDAIMKHYKDDYYISDEKFELCYEVAEKELKLLSEVDYKDGYSLYAGIPFCPTICGYCSFSSSPLDKWADQVDAYLDALEKEAAYVKELYKDKKLTSIYVGGGTPTSLDIAGLKRLFAILKDNFDVDGTVEFCVEAGRPDTITEEKLMLLKEMGVNRISINPQSMNQKTLDTIGRKHTVEQVEESYALARKLGFDNINMDMIVGLPGETVEDVKYTVEKIASMDPDSITIHSLAIKRAARLNTEDNFKPDYEAAEVNEMISACYDTCRSISMKPYYMYRQKNMVGEMENTGFTKEGKECIYNILMMEERQTVVAIGAGGSTKLIEEDRVEREENVKSVKDYIERIDEMLERKAALLK